MQKIEHIGIAVKNLKEATSRYKQLFGIEPYKTELVESEAVRTVFFQLDHSKIELLEATNNQSPIARFIEKKGEGIHHIAYATDDILSEMKRLSDLGFRLLNDKPKAGADNKLVCFIHPASAGGILIELCQHVEEAS